MNIKEALEKANNGILKPPVCASEGWPNKAYTTIYGQFVCGECITRFNDYKQKYMNEILNNLNNNTGINIDSDKKGKVQEV